MEATGKQLEQPADVMRRAYGTKLESLRRAELNRLFEIHRIQHGDLIKDDLVALGKGVEAMGYDLWKRPEDQSLPKSPFPTIAPTPSMNIEGSGSGRTTQASLEDGPAPEALPMDDRPVASDVPVDDVAQDEWPILKGLAWGEMKSLVKDMGLKQSSTDRRVDHTTNVMAHCSTAQIEEWIASNVANKDAT